MKILFIIHDFLPDHQAGAEIYTYLLAKELSKKHEVCIFFTEANPLNVSYKVGKRFYDKLQCIEVLRPLPIDLLGEPYKNEKMEDFFQTVLSEFKPDIIHFQHLLFHSFSYPGIAKQHNIPTLFTLHDFWLACPRWGQRLRWNLEICYTVEREKCADCLTKRPANLNKFSLSSLYHALRKKNTPNTTIDRLSSLKDRDDQAIATIKDVDLFIAPSPFLRDEFIEFGIPKDKIVFSDYGFETSGFTKRRRKRSSTIRFGFIGTISEHKGVHVLVEAFNKIPENKAELSIYGNLNWFPEYSGKLRKMARSPAIFFKGTIPNNAVADLLTQIDILVVPSIWFENSPLTIHEAFMAGVPVITSNIGGMADLVTDGVNGLLFTVNDSQQLSDCMLKLVESAGLLNTLRQGIPPVKSIQENGQEMERIYQQLLA